MSGEFSFADLENEIDSIRESASEPSEGVIAHAATTEEGDDGAESISSDVGSQGIRDSAGNIFDALIHATDAEGKPSLTKTGKFRKRRGSSVAQVQQAQAVNALNEADRQRKRQTGRTFADMMFSVCVTLGGEDWTPQGAEDFKGELEINEYNQIRNAFADWAESSDVELSAGKALGIAVAGYVLPRLIASEETHKRLGLFAGFIKPKMLKLRKLFTRKGKKNASQSNSRDERERKDDAGKDDGRESR